MSMQNDYPTVAPSEFVAVAGERVDTLINNMRVNLERSPRAKAEWIAKRRKVVGEALATTETIVISGRTPKVQTIRQPINGQVAMIDWLNITFDIATVGEKFRRTNEDDDQYLALCQAAVAEIAVLITKIFGKKYAAIEQRQSGANFYKYSFDFGENYGKICIGGQRDSVLIMLNGTGCALAPDGWETYMYQFLNMKSRCNGHYSCCHRV